MGNRKSKPVVCEDPYLLMDRRRTFNSSCSSYSPRSESTNNTFSTDLFMKIGTRIATVTAVYERVTPNRANLPFPVIPTVHNGGYDIPNEFPKPVKR